VVLIGDAAHFFGPETGVGAGLGLGDAHALAHDLTEAFITGESNAFVAPEATESEATPA
jgi:2-polyprenyl-6-methoxyphenol hydroxylase-like FAD-dependent oxidoreductase